MEVETQETKTQQTQLLQQASAAASQRGASNSTKDARERLSFAGHEPRFGKTGHQKDARRFCISISLFVFDIYIQA